MKFPVTAEPEPGMLLPEQIAALAEHAIIPSLETLAEWKQTARSVPFLLPEPIAT